MRKEQLEKMIHRRLQWHEFSDKGRLVACGKFPGADSIEMVERYGSPDAPCLLKCAGTDGFVPLKEPGALAMCRTCTERRSPFVSYAVYHEELRAVPSGCPHAIGGALDADGGGEPTDAQDAPYKALDNEASAPAYILRGSPGRGKIAPRSWKIYDTGEKVTLAVQYRRSFFVDGKAAIIHEYLYTNISCNVSTGQTYISDLHSGNKRYRKPRSMVDAQMENLSVTGASEILGELPDSDALMEPLRELCAHLASRLREMWDTDPSLVGDGGDIVKKEDALYVSPHGLLREIARLNRYPLLSDFPLPVHLRGSLALYARRRFDKLPRDVRPSDIASRLHLPSADALAPYMEESLENAPLAVMLDEWGIPFPEGEEEIGALLKEAQEILVTKMEPDQNPKHWHTYELFDMCSIAVPPHLIGIPLPRYGNACISGAADLLLGDAAREIAARREEICAPLANVFAKKGRRWSMRYGSPSSSFYFSPNRGSVEDLFLVCESAGAKAGGEEVEPLCKIELAQTMYLDRRTWNKAHSRRYVEWLSALKDHLDDRLSCNDGGAMEQDPYKTVLDAMESLPEDLARERDYLKKRLLSAVRFSLESMRAFLWYKGLGSPGAPPEPDCVAALYEWYHRNGIAISKVAELSLPQADVRKQHKALEKRVERRRKRKREERARA